MDVRKKLPIRQSVRLRNFDYTSNGAYFVTICTQNRACILGEVADQSVALTISGRIVDQHWRAIPTNFPNVTLDMHIVMPNHIHGIIVLQRFKQVELVNSATPGLGDIVRAFKARVTIETRRSTGNLAVPIWQRNYYEHVIRSDEELNRIRQYITDNPSNWDVDCENPLASP
jgi:REP element-mobilizing transposase RayT